MNFDLIYGLPGQTAATWAATLRSVIDLAPDRLAVFSFAYIPEVRPHQRKLEVALLPRGAAKLELLRIAREMFGDAGYRAIGMDHFALPGDELALAREAGTLWRDFQGYTTRRAAETVAVGATGIADLDVAFVQNVRGLGPYRDAIAAGRLATERGLRLSDDDRRRREVITELMCNLRVDLGGARSGLFDDELEELRGSAGEGLVEFPGNDVVSLTPLGELFVRNVAMVFDARLRERRASGERRPAFSRTV